MNAIARRARDIGRILDEHYRNLTIDLSRRGWRTREPCPVDPETPTLLASAVRRAMELLECNEAELAERIGVSEEQLRTWSQPFPGHAPPDADSPPRLRLSYGL